MWITWQNYHFTIYSKLQNYWLYKNSLRWLNGKHWIKYFVTLLIQKLLNFKIQPQLMIPFNIIFESLRFQQIHTADLTFIWWKYNQYAFLTYFHTNHEYEALKQLITNRVKNWHHRAIFKGSVVNGKTTYLGYHRVLIQVLFFFQNT